MLEKIIDSLTKKTLHKSAKTVKQEIKKKVDTVTTGDNGQKLLIGAAITSVVALIFAFRGSRSIVVNVYNN